MYCCIMAYHRALIWFCAHLMLVISTVTARKACDTRKCRRAPLTHYTSLLCTSEYEKDECCPARYNCDHLYDRYSRRHNTCYINGHEYALGVNLREYDSTFCEENCICKDKNGIADFECKTRKKCPPYQLSRPGCYQQNPLQECCPTKEICLNKDEVNACLYIAPGEDLFNYSMLVYSAGEYVLPSFLDPRIAICEGNRTNSTNTSFPEESDFVDLKYWSDVHAAAGFYKNCAPVYLLDKHGSIGLRTEIWRCQESGDYILHITRILFDNIKDEPKIIWHKNDGKHKKTPGVYGIYAEFMSSHGPLPAMQCLYNIPRKVPCHNFQTWKHAHELMNKNEPCRLLNPDGPRTVTYNLRHRKLCKFGQKTMHIHDVLNRIPYGHGNNSCIVCSCEVPPVPTCVLHQDKPCKQYMHCSEKDIIYGKCK